MTYKEVKLSCPVPWTSNSDRDGPDEFFVWNNKRIMMAAQARKMMPHELTTTLTDQSPAGKIDVCVNLPSIMYMSVAACILLSCRFCSFVNMLLISVSSPCTSLKLFLTEQLKNCYCSLSPHWQHTFCHLPKSWHLFSIFKSFVG